MDGKSPDKLGFKGRMLIFSALEKTYGRECAFDIATKSDDHVLKLVAIAAADEHAAQVLLHDLATLSQKREGTPQHNAARWQRRLNRALDRARYDTPKTPPKRARWSASDAQTAGAETPQRHEPARAPRSLTLTARWDGRVT